MIDIHSHVLFGVDDGAENIDVSLRMLELAIESGTKTLILTPHILNAVEPAWVNLCDRNMATLEEEIARRGWNITLLRGSEIYLQSNIMDHSIHPFFTLDLNNKFVLMELPSIEIAQFTEQMVFSLQRKGYYPILAHPERNPTLLSNIDRVDELVARGVYMQINAGSLLGHFGRDSERYAWRLLQSGLVHFVASDAHDFRSRKPVLDEAYKIVAFQIGEEVAKLIFNDNQQCMLDNKPITPTPIVDIPKGIWQRITKFFIK